MIDHKSNLLYGTTILSVRKNGKVAIAGDGQVSFGNTVLKSNAKKVRRLGDGSRTWRIREQAYRKHRP
jgi:ATP-dependent HslUV protease subunit HslV